MRSGKAVGAGLTAAVIVSLLTGIGPEAALAVQHPQTAIVATRPAAWTPWVDDGSVRAITQVGSKIIVGGTFTSVRAPNASMGIPRSNLFAFDAATGAIDMAFAPTLDGGVNALAPTPDGSGVIVGGTFSTVNGVERRGLVALSLTGGIIPGFAGSTTGGGVLDLTVRQGRLFIGGRFTTVNGVARPYLAALDATSGELDPRLAPTVAGTFNGGSTHVVALDVTPDATRMVIVGNFMSVDGLDRAQIAQVDLTTSPHRVADWETDRLKPACHPKYTTITNDVDYAPDGSFFALVTSGALSGGVDAGVLCDTATRWETNAVGTGLQPTWIDHAGGDSQVGVAVTSAAVYTSGHMRWLNSPYVGDAVGPGAVSRLGLSALDPTNGLPFTWNPTRDVSAGSWDTALFATSTGLWVGSDRDSFAGEVHRRLAFFPLSGGTTVPIPTPGALPGRLFAVPETSCAAADPTILYRVDAGGPGVPSTDCGPAWMADTGILSPGALHHDLLARTAATARRITVPFAPNGPVPRTVPPEVFATERWDPDDGIDMSWDFAVPAGTRVELRLFFSNNCECPGPRGSFDVRVENALVLDEYNVWNAAGLRVGTMVAIPATSDGNLDIDLRRSNDNPWVNAIEIVRTDVAPVAPEPRPYLTWRTFDGTALGASTRLDTPSTDWASVRGAFMIDDTVYAGHADGNLYARTFDGSSLGAARLVSPYAMENGPVFARTTGMFYSSGRLYYTQAGDPTMHWRYFTRESGVVGAVRFDVPASGFDWSNSAGLTFASGSLYWSTANGNLHTAAFANGTPTGADRVISGPSLDGQRWGGRGMFLLVEPPAAPPALFSDGFESGDLSRWDASTGMTVQSNDVFSGSRAATGIANGGTAYAMERLSAATAMLTFSTRFKIVSQGTTAVNVLRLQDPTGAANLVTTFVSQAGALMVRNDVRATNLSSSVSVSRGVWHELRLEVRIDGPSSTVRVVYDGAQVDSLTKTIDLGSTPIGGLILGDNNPGRTSEMRYDDVVAS